MWYERVSGYELEEKWVWISVLGKGGHVLDKIIQWTKIWNNWWISSSVQEITRKEFTRALRMRGRRVKMRNHRELGVLAFWLYRINKYKEKLLKSFEDIKSNITIQVHNPTIAFLNPKNSENQIIFYFFIFYFFFFRLFFNWCKNLFGRSDLRRLDVSQFFSSHVF